MYSSIMRRSLTKGSIYMYIYLCKILHNHIYSNVQAYVYFLYVIKQNENSISSSLMRYVLMKGLIYNVYVWICIYIFVYV
jgi:hypothetical protein